MLVADSTTQVAVNYLHFLNLAGKAPDPDLEKGVPSLCSQECTKIVNRETVFTTRADFAPQLRKAHETYGKWKVKEDYRIEHSRRERSITIKYDVETEKKGNILAIAILKVSPAFLITEIDEIYMED